MLKKIDRVRQAITYSLAIVLGSALVVGNMAGQQVVRPNLSTIGKYGPHFEPEERFEHGFPFTYLWRGGSLPAVGRSSAACWDIGRDVTRFDSFRLLTNFVIGFAALAVTAIACNKGLQRKKRLVQLSAAELLLCVGLVACLAGFYAHARSDYIRELRILQAMTASSSSDGEFSHDIVWNLGGPTWLRRLIGDTPFRVFDRVVSVDSVGEQLEYVVGLREVRAVRITGTVSNSQLKLLEQMPHLETLDLSFVTLDEESEIIDENGVVFEPYLCLPKMPTLRGVNLHDIAFRGDGLEVIPSVEVLDLTDTDVGDGSVSALANLERLKQLLISGTKISDDGSMHLRKVKSSCDIVR